MGQHARFRFATVIGITRAIIILSLPAITLPSDQDYSFGSFGMPVGADAAMTLHQTPATESRATEEAVVDHAGTSGRTVPVASETPPVEVSLDHSAATVVKGQPMWSFPSDIRMKKDVEDVAYGLSFIRQLRPVQYKLKDGNDRYDFGFIAQEVEFLLGDNYNILGIGSGPDRMLSLRYTDFIAPLVKAVQEQQAQLEAQRAMIEELRSEISALKRRAQ